MTDATNTPAPTLKSDVIAEVARATGLPRYSAEQAVNATLEAIANSLDDRRPVRLAGFGAFLPTTREPRRTCLRGEELITRRIHSVRFMPYNNLKRFEE